MQQLSDFIHALDSLPAVPIFPGDLSKTDGAVFTGCGDSLASAYVAQRRGYRAMSAGDIEWMEELPSKSDAIAGISLSGTSGAPIRALRRARAAGLRTVAITAHADTPLGKAADFVQELPRLAIEEELPVAGHVMLSLGVASSIGLQVKDMPQRLAQLLDQHGADDVESIVAQMPSERPEAVTVLSLPELRSAGNYWTLKFMEGCGVAARDVPLEECGHVDYFIGPQKHLVATVLGRAGIKRAVTLTDALSRNGMDIIAFATSGDTIPGVAAEDDLARELYAAVVGTYAIRQTAQLWGRPVFRGGAVNMDASHINIGH